MKEKVLSIPFSAAGTSWTGTGSAVWITPYSLTFVGASLWHTSDAGATITVTNGGSTGQGTATLTMGTGGSVTVGVLYTGTTPFGGAGTSIQSLWIPRNGTIFVAGSVGGAAAGTAAQTSIMTYWHVNE